MNRRDFLSKLLLPAAGGVALACCHSTGPRLVVSFKAESSKSVEAAGLDLSARTDMQWLGIRYIANDAEFLESVKFTREQIAAIYRVPVEFLGDVRTVGVSPLQPLADYLRANPRMREALIAKYGHAY